MNRPYTMRHLRRGRWRVVCSSCDLETIIESAEADETRLRNGTIAVFAGRRKVWPDGATNYVSSDGRVITRVLRPANPRSKP